MKYLAALLALGLSTLSAQGTFGTPYCQTLPPNLENATTSQTSTIPFGLDPVPPSTVARSRTQYIYDSSMFCNQGPIEITNLSFRARSEALENLSGGDWSDVTILLGTTADLTTVTGAFNTNYATGPVMVRSGPFNTGPITIGTGPTGDWISLGLTSTFTYDPSMGQDLVVEIRRCEGTSAIAGPLTPLPGAGNDVINSPLARRVSATGSVGTVPSVCSGTSANGSVSAGGSPFALILKMEYVVSPFASVAWETNSPECSLDLDGLQNTVCGPIDVRKCINSYTRINLKSTLVGQGWDLGISMFPGLAGNGGGGVNTANGQVVNLDLVSQVGFANDLTFPAWVADIKIPFFSSTPFAIFSGQMAVLDAAHPDGVHLSALAQLHYDAPTPLAAPVLGPTADDGVVTVNVGCVPFYGFAFSQMHVCTNGRIIFGPAFNTTDFTPTVNECRIQQPMVGVFTDLHVTPTPTGGPVGTITITSPTADTFRATWAGIYYRATTTSMTFSIEINTTTGAISLDTGTGLAQNPEPGVPGAADAMFLGLSRGLHGSTDAGVTAFGIGSGSTLNQTDMLYNFAALGGPGLMGGAVQLVFTPIVGGPADRKDRKSVV